jgi:hypothetical protein
MRRLPILIFIASLIFSTFSCAASDTEAQALLEDSRQSLREGLYRHSLSSAHLAREIYGQAGNGVAVETTDTLIAAIENNLSKSQLADLYFQISKEYQITGWDDAVVVRRALMMAQKCVYACGNALNCSLQCSEIEEKSKERLIVLQDKCISDAHLVLKTSEDLKSKGDLLNSRLFAQNASDAYQACPYEQGVNSAEELLTSLRARMREIGVQASGAYDQALEDFSRGDNLSCAKYSNISFSLFTKTGDIEGSSMSKSLFEECTHVANPEEIKERRRAESYVNKSRYLYQVLVPADCINASYQARQAAEVYLELYRRVYETEKGLPYPEREKTRFYLGKSNEVSLLVEDIKKTCVLLSEFKRAEEIYGRALERYDRLYLNEALADAKEAKGIFNGIQKYIEARKATSLIQQIEQSLRLKNEADGYMSAVKARYDEGDFTEGIEIAQKAKTDYMSIGDADGMANADNWSKMMNEASKKSMDANRRLLLAKELIGKGEYDLALVEAKSAESVFQYIAFKKNVELARGQILLIQEKIDQIRSLYWLSIGAVVLVAVLIVILNHKYPIGRDSLESQIHEKKQHEQELMIRKTEELSKQIEEDAKEKIEEELRRLVENERNRMKTEK